MIAASLPLLLFVITVTPVWVTRIDVPAVDVNAQIRQTLQRGFRETTFAEFLSHATTTQHPLFCNLPQELALVLQKPVVGIPTTAFTRRTLDAARAKELADAFQVRYVVCLKIANHEEAPLHSNQPFFEMSDRTTTPSWLTQVFSDNQLALYERVNWSAARPPQQNKSSP